MNLAGVIERKGKQERIMDEVTETIRSHFEQHMKQFEGRPYNNQLTEEIQRAARRMNEELQALYAPMERILVDVSLSNSARDEANIAADLMTTFRPGVYTRF